MGFLNRAEMLSLSKCTNPDYLRSQAMRPFKFDVVEQMELRRRAEELTPIPELEFDRYVHLSQIPDFINECLRFSTETVKNGMNSTLSEMQLLRAGNIMRNLAWFSGIHLEIVVKNAAYYEGDHIPLVIKLAVTLWEKTSIRIQFDFIRAVASIAEYSIDLLKTSEVRAFLQKEAKSLNPLARSQANQLLHQIFGE
jgi:hypothetical protein